MSDRDQKKSKKSKSSLFCGLLKLKKSKKFAPSSQPTELFKTADSAQFPVSYRDLQCVSPTEIHSQSFETRLHCNVQTHTYTADMIRGQGDAPHPLSLLDTRQTGGDRFLSARRHPEAWKRLVPTNELRFNPGTSKAVCIGVGRQHLFPEQMKSYDLGKAPEFDAIGVSQLLNDRLAIHVNEAVILTCDQTMNPGVDPVIPTRDAILKEIRRNSLAVGGDGVLWIHFSGHGQRMEDNYPQEVVAELSYNGVLAPYNHNLKRGLFINCNDFIDAIGDSQARAVVLTLDSCHSGSFVQDVCASMARKARPVPVFAFPACSPEQLSVNWPQLEKGLFTHVLLHFLSRLGQPGLLPARQLQTQLTETFCILNTLHEPGFTTGITRIDPDAVVCAGRAMNVQPCLVAPLAVPNLPSRFQRSNSFQDVENYKLEELEKEMQHSVFGSEEIGESLLKDVCGWMTDVAEPLVLQLESLGLLASIPFLKHCYAYTVYTLVVKLHRTGVPLEQLLSPHLAYLLWKKICLKLPLLLSSSKENLQDAFDLFSCYLKRLSSLVQLSRTQEQPLRQLLEVCQDINQRVVITYNDTNGTDIEATPLEETDLDCAIPPVPVPQLTDELCALLKQR